jgi:hypothetical protein
MDTAIRLLAVVGGAALGAGALGAAVRFVGKRLGAREGPPRRLFALVRLLAAVAAGWVVWLFVFGTGGPRLGGPGGFGSGGGTGPPAAEGPAPAPQRAAATRDQNLVVIMRGGDRLEDGRFYRVEGESAARTLGELKELIRKRQAEGLSEIEIRVYDTSVASGHAAVADLRDWADRHELRVTVQPFKGDAP